MDSAVDTWRIRDLRGPRRRQRLEGILFPARENGFVDRLVEHVQRLETELEGLRTAAGGTRQACGHLLFLATAAGYELVESREPAPPEEQLLLLESGCYRVVRVGRSPLPGDGRPCLFLEAAVS